MRLSWCVPFLLSLHGCNEYDSLEEATDEVCFNLSCPIYCSSCMEKKWSHLGRMGDAKSFDTMSSCGYDSNPGCIEEAEEAEAA
mmetsp:Transcript_5789/g.6477  ORF Transcript_5789/g.6477 Transcript_5789/m.6477 type:complete len:84 (-) Transcript_5789:39-290(-)